MLTRLCALKKKPWQLENEALQPEKKRLGSLKMKLRSLKKALQPKRIKSERLLTNREKKFSQAKQKVG